MPIFGGDVSGGAIRRAAKLLGEGAEILCVYVVTIPTQLPLDAPMSTEQQRGLAVLEAARIAGRKSGLKVHTRLVTTRDPGDALVQEAVRAHADLVYLATTHAPPSEQGFGPIARQLLEKRPCWVVVESPAASRNGSRQRLAA